MGLKYLFDTYIFIYYLNGLDKYNNYFNINFLSKNKIYVSTIPKIELLSYPNIIKSQEKKIRLLLNEFEIIPLMEYIEELCIKIRKKFKIKIPDSIILSTAIYTGSKLITEDKKLIVILDKIRKK